jgi:hypothetical protein
LPAEAAKEPRKFTIFLSEAKAAILRHDKKPPFCPRAIGILAEGALDAFHACHGQTERETIKNKNGIGMKA